MNMIVLAVILACKGAASSASVFFKQLLRLPYFVANVFIDVDCRVQTYEV